MSEGKPIMLIECKSCGMELDISRCSQLSRYFTNTDARIALLTNGLSYQFFTDLDQRNKMDARPFMIVNFDALEENLIPEIKKLHKNNFDLETTLSTASELKYAREIKKTFASEIENPTEEFVRFFTTKVYSGRFTHNVKDQFTKIVKKALNEFLIEKITDDFESFVSGKKKEDEGQENVEANNELVSEDNGIVTTEEEWEGFYIIKSILRQVLSPNRITIRDRKSYCGILLDDTNRKPICRLHFNTSQKYLGLFDGDNKDDRVPLETVDDIYKYADRILATVAEYEEPQGK